MTVTAIPQTAAPADATDVPEKGSKKKLILILVAVLAIGGGGYFMFLKPTPAGPPEPGEVIALESIQVNLAAGHYLRIGIALQTIAGAGAHGPIDGSMALDAVIAEFSGLPMEKVNDPKHRAKLKKDLLHDLGELYHHEVMGVFFTEFVTQ